MAHRPDKAQKMKLYRQTVEGKASQMWSGIVGRCGNRFNNAKSYETVQIHFTRGEFIRWVVPELEKWIKHKPIASASVDRINSLRGYSKVGIQSNSFSIVDSMAGSTKQPSLHAGNVQPKWSLLNHTQKDAF